MQIEPKYTASVTLTASDGGMIALALLPFFRGDQGPAGPVGPVGAGVPIGGADGQVLAKIDAVDYNTAWIDPLVAETTFTITGVAPVIDNRDGTLQDWTLTGNSTPTFDMLNGGLILTINNAGNFSLDLSGVEFVSQDPTDAALVAAPIISQTKLTKLTIWADGADVYAQLIGYVSI